MDKQDILSALSVSGAPDQALLFTTINFILCVAMSVLIKIFYTRYSVSLTGKNHIGVVIPILSSIIFLVIMVVKSSLALSLGLVGALSIVRFRTPIKEPEELAYLFLAISVGLGYAAGHTFLTTSITLAILFMIYTWLSNKTIGKNNEYNLVINWSNQEVSFDNISNALLEKLEDLRLIRLDHSPTSNTAVMLVMPNKNVTIDNVIQEIRSLDAGAEISFYEAKTNW